MCAGFFSKGEGRVSAEGVGIVGAVSLPAGDRVCGGGCALFP